MVETTNQSSAVSRFGLAIVITVALFWSAIAFVPPGLLHAD